MHEYSKLVFMQHCWICDGRVMQNWIEFINHHKNGLTGVDYSYDAEFSVFITSFWSIYQSKYTNNHLMSVSYETLQQGCLGLPSITNKYLLSSFPEHFPKSVWPYTVLDIYSLVFANVMLQNTEYWVLLISSVSMSVNVKNLVIFWPWQLNINPCLTIRSEEQLLW